MNPAAPKLQNEIIDKIINDLKRDHEMIFRSASVCASVAFILRDYGLYINEGKEGFDFLSLPILKKFDDFWWPEGDINSRIDFLNVNRLPLQ